MECHIPSVGVEEGGRESGGIEVCVCVCVWGGKHKERRERAMLITVQITVDCSISSLWPIVALVKHCNKVKMDHISSLLPFFSLSLPSFLPASFPPFLSPPFQTCLSSLIRLPSSTERSTCITFSPVYPLPQRRARARSFPWRNRVKEIINWSIYLLIPRPFWL